MLAVGQVGQARPAKLVGMKRSEALQPLSRDHHQALAVALSLRRADAESAGAAAASFLEFWRSHGQAHFREEEEILLPAYAAHADAGHPLVARVLIDHVEIRERAQRLERVAPDAAPDELNELGERLAEHVRVEERELFPLIEAALPAEAAASLAAALADPENDRAEG